MRIYDIYGIYGRKALRLSLFLNGTFFLGVGPLSFSIRCFAYNIEHLISTCGASMEVVF